MADELGEPLSGMANPAADPKGPLLVLSVASFCELIAAAVVCASSDTCGGLTAYSVSVGCVSLAACIPLLLFQFDFFNAKGSNASEIIPHVTTFLLCWWSAGWFALTCIFPFSQLSNGFFACWTAPPAALMLCRALNPAIAGPLGRAVAAARGAGSEISVLCFLCTTSTIVWIEASVALAYAPHNHASIKVWALCVGILSMGACLMHLFVDGALAYSYTLSIGLGVWWVQGIAISFVPDAFNGSVNGFLCTWLSVGLAGYYASVARNPRKLEAISPADTEAEYNSMSVPDAAKSSFGGLISPGGFEGFSGGGAHSIPAMGIPGMLIPPLASVSPVQAGQCASDACTSQGSVSTPPQLPASTH